MLLFLLRLKNILIYSLRGIPLKKKKGFSLMNLLVKASEYRPLDMQDLIDTGM